MHSAKVAQLNQQAGIGWNPEEFPATRPLLDIARGKTYNPHASGEAMAFPAVFPKFSEEYDPCRHIPSENIPPDGGIAAARTTRYCRPPWLRAPIAARKFPPIPFARNAAIMMGGKSSNRRKSKPRNNPPETRKRPRSAAFFVPEREKLRNGIDNSVLDIESSFQN
jgi:hypothetical protein